jgi:predicted transcriptional regulator
MRTTLTLDDDIAEKLKQAARQTGLPFKQLVNQTLRLGLHYPQKINNGKVPFKVKARNLGLREGLNYDNIGELLEQGEGELHR